MTDNELKKLSRNDLLQMLLEQSKEVQSLRGRLAVAEAALQERTIAIDRAGSIAEASLQLNGVFEAAQAACQQYMDNISHLSQRQEQICARMEAESREKAEQLIAEAQRQKDATERETQLRCAEMLEKAKNESQSYWDSVSQKLEAFSAEHAELQWLLSLISTKTQQG